MSKTESFVTSEKAKTETLVDCIKIFAKCYSI